MASEEGVVIACDTEADFNTQMAKAKESGKLVIIDFTAPWSDPCRFISPAFVSLAKEFPHVVFLVVDIDFVQEVAVAYNIKSIPTFLFFKNGEKVETIMGANKDKLKAQIEKHTTASASTA